MLMQMVDHDNGIVHNQPKRNRQSGKRIQVDIHLHQVKNNSGNTQIDDDSQKQYTEIAQVSVDQKNEYDQNKNGKS